MTLKGHKVMKKHIKRRIDLGHDILEVKKYLLDKGFREHEVHKAIDAAFHELKKTEEFMKKFRRFIIPTKPKLLLPVIILVILLAHIFVNINALPGLGEELCISANLMLKIDNETSNKALVDLDIDKVAELEKNLIISEAKILDDFNSLLISSFPLVLTRFYWLNPFFPVPCESRGLLKGTYCRYYIDEPNYECLKDKVQMTKLGLLFEDDTPEYKKISLFWLFFNTLVLVFIFYLINCGIVYYYKSHRHKFKLRTIELLEFALTLLALMLIISAIYLYLYIVQLIVG